MKRALVLALLFAIPLNAFGQAKGIDENNLLNITRQNGPTEAHFNGSPFVYIGQTVGAPAQEAPSGWMDEEKKRLFGTTQITKNELLPNGRQTEQTPATRPTNIPNAGLKEISYSSPFGNKKSDAYTPHTTDFLTQIQVISKDTLLVEEHISYIDTQNNPFKRVLMLGKPVQDNETFELLSLEIDKKPITPQVQIDGKNITIAEQGFLPAGFHEVHLKYAVKDGISFLGGKGYIHYNITGTNWPLPVAQTAVHLSFPKKTNIYEKDLLFGTNYLSLKNAYSSLTDAKGNIAFKLNNPLPAYANTALYTSFNPNIFTEQSVIDKLESSPRVMVFLGALGFVLVYLLSAALFFKLQKPEKNVMKYVYGFNPLTLNRLKNVYPSYLLLENLADFYKEQHKKAPLECRLCKTGKWPIKALLSLFRYMRLTAQYYITSFILVLGVIYFAYSNNIYLTFVEYTLILVLAGALTAVFFHFAGRKKMLNEMKRYQTALADSNLFYGLKPQAALAVYNKNYPYALALGFRQKWTTHFKTCCPQAAQLSQKGD